MTDLREMTHDFTLSFDVTVDGKLSPKVTEEAALQMVKAADERVNVILDLATAHIQRIIPGLSALPPLELFRASLKKPMSRRAVAVLALLAKSPGKLLTVRDIQRLTRRLMTSNELSRELGAVREAIGDTDDELIQTRRSTDDDYPYAYRANRAFRWVVIAISDQ